MAVEICPLSIDWGNAADWASVAIGALGVAAAVMSVVVALLGAIAVAYLAFQANRLGFKGARQAEAQRRRETDLLMILFEGELSLIDLRLQSAEIAFDAPGEDYADSLTKREEVAKWAAMAELPEIDAHFARIHVLPDPVANAIARLKGTLSVVRMTAAAGVSMDVVDSKTLAPRVREALRNTRKICDFLIGETRERRRSLKPDPFVP
jgi:hypothetical protein